MTKKNLYFFTGLKGFLISFITMLTMIFPLWLIKFIFNLSIPGLTVVSGILAIVWIFLYFLVWGTFANKLWRWN